MLRKRLGKKGFTLVEVIVVLVILAILAAILIPSMVKWIDRARDKSALVAARTMLLAAQTVASEKYGAATSVADFSLMTYQSDIEALAGIGTGLLTGGGVEAGAVTSMTMTYQGKAITYTPAGGFVVADA